LEENSQLLPGEVYSSICLYLTEAYAQKKEWDKAKNMLEVALSPPESFARNLVTGYPADVYMALGQVNLELKNKKEALEYFAQADSNAVSDPLIHFSLQNIYQTLGESAKAKEQEKWLEEFRVEQERAMKEAE
jgi:tetratricopeptide (TPR) repeat protein